MESGDDGLESEANVRPRPRLTRAGSPGARWTAIDRGLFAGSTGASAAKSKRQGSRNRPFSTIPKMWNDSVRQAARGNTEVTSDRTTGLAFIGICRVSRALAKSHKPHTRARIFSSLDASSSRLAHSCLGLRTVRSPVGRPRIRRRFSGDGRSNPVGGNAGARGSSLP
jgi:hypothetical protein